MRFCPFCSAQNQAAAATCDACGRKLPPVPERRARAGLVAPGITASSGVPEPTGGGEGGGVTEISEATLSAGLSAAAVPIPSPLAGPSAATTPLLAPPTAATLPVAMRGRQATAPPPLPSSIGAALQRATGEVPAVGAPAAVGAYVPSTPRPSISAERRAVPAPSTPPPPGTPPRRREDSAPPPVPPPRATTGPVQVPVVPSVASSVAPPAGAQAVDGGGPAAAPASAAVEPPPTIHIQLEGFVDRPYAPARVASLPEVPEGGLVRAAAYTLRFSRARWQRRGAIRQLTAEIASDTSALDAVLGALGKAARAPRVVHKALEAEHAAIDAAEARRGGAQAGSQELADRRAEEDRRFAELEVARGGKVSEAERELASAQQAKEHVEGQRRSLRERRKELERRQHAYYKAADDREAEASGQAIGEGRNELRRAAEGHRREAQEMDAEKRELDAKLAALEEPGRQAQAAVDAALGVLDVAKQALSDVRAGHASRLTELDDEQKRKARDLDDAAGEVARRLITLGTLVNLNRVDGPQFAELYARIDRIRGAIGARTTEIDRLTAERSAFDRPTLVRGIATLAGVLVALIIVALLLRTLL